MSMAAACSHLKIWPKRTRLYEKAVSRFKLATLYKLLQDSKQLDEQIKTSQGNQIWQSLERLAISLCLGSLVVSN